MPSHKEVQRLKVAPRQAHNMKWAEIFGIPDLCGPFQGYQQIVAIYIKYVQCGVNYYNKQALRLATLQGYAKAVNTLFKLHKFAPPADLMDQNNMTVILVNNLLKEEDIRRQWSPLNNSIFAEPQQMFKNIHDKDLVHNLLFGVVALGHYIGPRLSKYTQTTQDKVDVHTYPSGTTVVKAFVANNFIFYDNKQHTINKLCEASLNKAALVKITWEIQKNCQNNQAITLVADTAKPNTCPVQSMMQMVLQACRHLQPDNMPVAIYKTKRARRFTSPVTRLPSF
jgi:hypothetical protein